MAGYFQAGTLNGFLQGIYDGDYTFASLAKKGDFGLGTINAVDGEMVAVDGTFYRVDAQGIVSHIPPTERTPYAVVCQFKPVVNFAIKAVPSLTALSNLLDTHLSTPNIFYMIRIDGQFESLQLRSEECQIRGAYRPLAESLPTLQREFEVKNSTGTLVVSYAPAYSAGVTIPSYHYHYINAERTTGGHVFDLNLQSATVKIMPIRQFEMAVNNSPEFDQADLTLDLTKALQGIEKK